MSQQAPQSTAFDPSARLTPANFVTLGRLLASPVLILLILDSGPSYAALSLGFCIAITDAVDGWMARKWGSTRSGAFLDPLADKVMVLGAMGALVAIDEFPLLPVALIAGREIAMSVYRSYWGRRGLAIPARRSGKIKTIVQEFALAFALLPPVVDNASWLPLSVLWLAVAFTLGSAVQYVADGSRALSTSGEK